MTVCMPPGSGGGLGRSSSGSAGRFTTTFSMAGDGEPKGAPSWANPLGFDLAESFARVVSMLPQKRATSRVDEMPTSSMKGPGAPSPSPIGVPWPMPAIRCVSRALRTQRAQARDRIGDVSQLGRPVYDAQNWTQP